MTDICPGSGGWPAEMTILDTTPGCNPPGTCPICGSSLTLNPWRIPEHQTKSMKRETA